MTTFTNSDSSYLDHCIFQVRRALMDPELANTELLSLEGEPPLRFIDHFRNEAMEQLLELAPPPTEESKFFAMHTPLSPEEEEAFPF